MEPIVSVIVPLYKTEKYIERCLKSIMEQTFKAIEIICIDDCSPDSSARIVELIQIHDARITLIKNKKNIGSGGSRNVGLQRARGSYILFVDSDDHIMPNMIDVLYNKMINSNYDVVVCGFLRIDESGNLIMKYAPEEKVVRRENKNFNIFTVATPECWNKLWKKSTFFDNGIFFPEQIFYQDLATTVRIFLKCDSICFVKEAYYVHNWRAGATSSSHSEKNIIDYLRAFDIIKEFLIRERIYDEYNERFKTAFSKHIEYHAGNAERNNTLQQDAKLTYLRYLFLLGNSYILLDDGMRMLNIDELMAAFGKTNLLPSSVTSAAQMVGSAAQRGKGGFTKLGIIIPYRNRYSQLASFIPHLISYFRRDVSGKRLDIRIIVVEQNDDLPFNRGALLNAGFLAIVDQVDYICFHDVDYLPMWADYSYSDAPTRVIWWGMHSRPIRSKDPSLRTYAPLCGLGAVTLFTVEDFRAVNGYSNKFFGWGFEDKDLAARCRLHSLPIEQRDGTFIPLEHDNAGFNEDGSKSPEWLENERRYAENQREYEHQGSASEGLSSFAGRVNPIEFVRVSGLDGADEADVMYLSVNFDQSPAAILKNAETPRLLRSLPSATVSHVTVLSPLPPAPAPVPIKDIKRSRSQKICLSMIVKDEVSVIARCLASVRPLIDYWVVVDTGSTDGTQSVIRKSLQDIPGELHERPWVDFAHNRSEALTLARNHGDYSLIIDADDVLDLPPGFRLPFLKEDSIVIEIRNKGRRFLRPQLVRNTVPWRWEGVLHEFLSWADKNGRRIFAENRSQKRLPGVKIVMTEEGARRRTSPTERYARDALVFENALQTETDPFLVARYKFYLAQSYLDAGEKQKALVSYQERAKLGFWNQEIFISLYRSANIKAELGYDADDVIQTYLQADRVVAGRAEALHGAARFCRHHERFQEGLEFARRALHLKPPADGLFLDDWVYDYGVLDEYAVNAYWTERYADCLAACERLLRNPKIPAETRLRVERNAGFAREKLSSQQISGKLESFEAPQNQKRRN